MYIILFVQENALGKTRSNYLTARLQSMEYLWMGYQKMFYSSILHHNYGKVTMRKILTNKGLYHMTSKDSDVLTTNTHIHMQSYSL